MLDNIYLILQETSHSGNIGSAARAMKTMGLTHLRLVAPKQGIDEQAIALAAGAQDVLAQAEIFDTLDEAIADCTLIIGTSARLRHLQNTLLEPRECGELIRCQSQKTAIIFGRERVGLTNDELLKCHYHLCIPSNPEYSSLNLAMAVQIICYELRLAAQAVGNLQKNTEIPPLGELAEWAELEHFYQHTERLFSELGFIRNESVIRKLRHLYQRAKLEKNELNLLRGMLSSVEKALAKKG